MPCGSAFAPARTVPLLARIGVEPRPYQLVPLLMALKLDPVRLLIADDVGIGKTIEAGLIARELLDRGEINRLAVLCPPHLAEQWQRSCREVPSRRRAGAAQHGRPSGAGLRARPVVVRHLSLHHRLDRLHQVHRRRDDFLRTCPELVIVDEAHTCAFRREQRGRRQRSPPVVKGLAARSGPAPDPGHRDAAQRQGGRLSLAARPLEPDFDDLPDDLSGRETEVGSVAAGRALRAAATRRHPPLLGRRHAVPGARRGRETTPVARVPQALRSGAGLCSRDGAGAGRSHHRQRVRWWSALALLRSPGSSPAAAAATLRTRAATADTEDAEEADDVGERSCSTWRSDDAAEAHGHGARRPGSRRYDDPAMAKR